MWDERRNGGLPRDAASVGEGQSQGTEITTPLPSGAGRPGPIRMSCNGLDAYKTIQLRLLKAHLSVVQSRHPSNRTRRQNRCRGRFGGRQVGGSKMVLCQIFVQ